MSIESAEKAVAKAKGERDKWSEKLRDAQAEQVALAERHAEVDVTPEHAASIFAEQDAAEQKLLGIVEKIEPRIQRAAERVAEAEREVLRAHAEDEQKLADEARKTWRGHEQKSSRALSAYLELEGVASLGDLGYEQWRPARDVAEGSTGAARRIHLSRSRILYNAYVSAQARVQSILFFLETGARALKVSASGETVSVGNMPASGRALTWDEKPECIYGERPAPVESKPVQPGSSLEGMDARTWSEIPKMHPPGWTPEPEPEQPKFAGKW